MLSKSQLLLRSTGGSLFRHGARGKAGHRTMRHFSSVVQDYLQGDEEEDSDTKEANQRHQQQVLKSFLEASAAPPAKAHESLKEQSNAGPRAVAGTEDSPSELTYTGGATMPITSRAQIVTPKEDTPRGIWPIFRIMVSHWLKGTLADLSGHC